MPVETVNDLLLSAPDSQPPVCIDSFRGRWEFLSNFFYCPVTVNLITYPSAEHAYQAMKCRRRADFERVMACVKPEEAKRVGRTVEQVDGWEELKMERMAEVLRAKFKNPFLRDLLLLTGEVELVEGNDWGDRFWGRCNKTGEGENVLGQLLMMVREEVREEVWG
jgi:ribA/ribD-fused uncharacterized protein